MTIACAIICYRALVVSSSGVGAGRWVVEAEAAGAVEGAFGAADL